MIDKKYLPFSRDELRQHFLVDWEGQIKYFEESAARYRQFVGERQTLAGIPISQARLARQIEKDERFWTAASLKHIFQHPKRLPILASLLSGAFGPTPPIEGLASWEECVAGELSLYFEAQLPSPRGYTEWLQQRCTERHSIPYVLDAASRSGRRRLEGPTHLDAILINPTNGFSLLIEAKVLSDISTHVTFDMFRNQMARCIDVMLEPYPRSPLALGKRRPERSLFALLTPMAFRRTPRSRLYGWLLEEYRSSPNALARDLPHRDIADWGPVSSRLGWLTFEEIADACSGACPWLPEAPHAREEYATAP